jgi:hemoglobin/transferrin/lactoferrin receptor protein
MKHSFLFSGTWARAAAFAALLAGLGVAPGSAQSPGPRLSARVVDATTGRPLAAASVTSGRLFALTATDGTFSLPRAPGSDSIHVERMGYASVALPFGGIPAEIHLVPSPYLLERIAVEVDRGERIASGTALSAAAVGRSTLDAVAGTSVAEALTGIEGVQTSRVGSWGSRAVVRGLTGERLAVLIDGNRVNRACTFGMDQGLASVDPGQVQAVEVVAGPGSALYGSGSVGGVINVVTRAPSFAPGMTGEFRAAASSAVPGGTVGGHMNVAGPRLAVGLSLDASDYGDYRTPVATVDGSSYRQVTADLKADYRPAEAHLLSLKAQRYAGRDIGWPMMMGASIPEETRTSFSLDYGWQIGGGTVDGLSLRAYRQKLDHHMVVDAIMQGPMGPMSSKADAVSYSNSTGARAQLRLTPAQGVRADVGLEANRWFAEGTRWTETTSGTMPATTNDFRTWPAVTIDDLGSFAQGEARLGDRLTLSFGGRMDRVTRDAEDRASTTETILTGNTGLRADMGSGFGARASLGLGYRNPDPMELYGLALKPDGFVYRGSADLATERSFSSELSVSWSGEGGGLSVTGFRNRLRDMVSLVLVPNEKVAMRPVREYTSLGSAVLEGVTASADAALGGGFRAAVGGSYTRAEDEDTGMPLVGIPSGTLDATLRRDFAGPIQWVEVAAEAAAAQDRVAESAGEVATPGYAVAHLRMGIDLRGTRLVAGAENLFDREYRAHLDPVRLLRPGRNFFLRLTRPF